MKVQRQGLREWGKSLTGRAIFGSGLHELLMTDSAIVVTFHRVNNVTVGDGLTCGVKLFEEYCRFFASHFRVVSLRRLVEKMDRSEPLDRKVAITFDDGYRDNYEYAAPVLKRIGLPATFFVVTDYIGSDVVAWWDEKISVRQPWMTWNQVRELCREGFDIGTHTRTHPDMGKIGGAQAQDEILGSRLALEEKLSRPVDLFAYPYGREDQMTEANREIVRAAGLRCCCSCFGGINSRGGNPFHLRRIPVTSWYSSPSHFGFEVALRGV